MTGLRYAARTTCRRRQVRLRRVRQWSKGSSGDAAHDCRFGPGYRHRNLQLRGECGTDGLVARRGADRRPRCRHRLPVGASKSNPDAGRGGLFPRHHDRLRAGDTGRSRPACPPDGLHGRSVAGHLFDRAHEQVGGRALLRVRLLRGLGSLLLKGQHLRQRALLGARRQHGTSKGAHDRPFQDRRLRIPAPVPAPATGTRLADAGVHRLPHAVVRPQRRPPPAGPRRRGALHGSGRRNARAVALAARVDLAFHDQHVAERQRADHGDCGVDACDGALRAAPLVGRWRPAGICDGEQALPGPADCVPPRATPVAGGGLDVGVHRRVQRPDLADVRMGAVRSLPRPSPRARRRRGLPGVAKPRRGGQQHLDPWTGVQTEALRCSRDVVRSGEACGVGVHHRRSRGDCLRWIAPAARRRQAAGVVGDPDSGDLAQPIPSADVRSHPASLVAHAPGRDLCSDDQGAFHDPSRMGRAQRVLAKRLADRSPAARDGHHGAASGRRASGGARPPTQAGGTG